jgi:hypothetical protein
MEDVERQDAEGLGSSDEERKFVNTNIPNFKKAKNLDGQ